MFLLKLNRKRKRQLASFTHTHTQTNRQSISGQRAVPSQRALQCVVVVLETLQLQEVLGPLAPLAGGGQVGDLDGGGGAADRRSRQVFSG